LFSGQVADESGRIATLCNGALTWLNGGKVAAAAKWPRRRSCLISRRFMRPNLMPVKAMDAGRSMLQTNTRRAPEEQIVTYSTLMVHLEPDQANDARLAIAAALAEKFAATVIGVAACELGQSLYFAEGAFAAKVIEDGRAQLKQRMADMEKQFRAALQKRAKNVEWRCAVEIPTPYIVQQARAADIVIIGSRRAESIADPLARLDPGDLLMRAGRPVLVVPPETNWLDLRSILVAWKDTREARRAVLDALPMLHKASQVTIVEIVETASDRSAAQDRVNDVAAWLAQHAIDASGLAANPTGSVTRQLETVAADVGANLIVAGGYGHARLREWAFGGVTRDLIARSKHCSLLSH
jgi:nucleotide-binding universal stress UspA family protein